MASIFSSILAYRMVYDGHIAREEIKKSIISHRGLLAEAIPSILIIFLAFISHLVSLQTALLAAIVFTILGFLAAILHIYTDETRNPITNVVIVSVQILFIAIIIFLKVEIH